MAVNESIYPNVYTYYTDSNYSTEIFKTTDGFIDKQKENMTIGQLWDNSNIFATFDPEKNKLYNLFGAMVSNISIGYDTKDIYSSYDGIFKNIENVSEATASKVNLRLVFHNSNLGNSGFCNIMNWSKIKYENIAFTQLSLVDPFYKSWYTYESIDDYSYERTKQNSYPLDRPNYKLINSIKRSNLFLVANITFAKINEDNSLTQLDNSTIPITKILYDNEDFDSSIFDKKIFNYNGDRVVIYSVSFHLYTKNSYNNYSEYNGWFSKKGDSNDNYNSGTLYPEYSLYILCERKVGDNIFYYSMPVAQINMKNFSIITKRNGYVSINATYNHDNHYEYNISTNIIALGEEAENYSKSISFYSYPDFNIDFDNLEYDKTFTNDEYTYYTKEDRTSQGLYHIDFNPPFFSIKDIYHMLSCFLIPFTFKYDNETINHEEKPDAYIGIRRESDGFVEGDWIKYEWGVTEPEDDLRPENFTPYDPNEVPPEPVTPDDDGDINIGSVPLSITDAFTNCYVLNTSTVNYIGKNLWNGLGSQQAESGLTFGGMIKNFFGLFTDVKSETTDSTYRELALNTVLDYFVSLRYYPIPTLFSLTQAIATHNFSVGTGQEPMAIQDASGFGRPLNRIVRMSGGQLTRAELNASGKVYNSFLDYQPNTTATLYIPYCGTVELTPSQLLDCDTIDIVYALDIMTGALSAIAMKNGTASYPLAMLQGTCGFETLVSGSNKGIVELATSISNLRFGANTSNQIVQGLTNSAVGSASQNAENAEVNTQAMLIRGIASAYNAGTSMYNYLVGLPTMTGVSPISAGSMSSLASTIMPQTAYIQLTKHSADIPTNFENTYGRTTNVYGSIGSYQGYLICGNPRLEGIPCTEHERDEIFSLLTTGVYVE